MKPCIKCNEVKPITQFYKHSKMRDGHLNICKPCHCERMTQRRRTNPEVQEYDRWRYQNHPHRKKATAQNAKRWNEQNPEGYKAHYLTSNAIRDGRLKRLPCEVCGDPKTHAHHDDYSKPLDVRWLCPTHHMRHHHQ